MWEGRDKDTSKRRQSASGWGLRQLQSLDRTNEIVERIHRSQTCCELCDCLLHYTRNFGATKLLCGLIPVPGLGRRDQMDHVLIDAWPEEWSQRYFSSGYLYRDPTIRLVARGCAPFLWSELDERCNVSPLGRRIMQEATDFRLKHGLTLAFVSIEGRPIGFSLAGENLELDPRQYPTIQLLAACAVGRALEISGRSISRPGLPLSDRQLEVLIWASRGLKPHEIAEQLGISSHTADMHLRAVRQRLGVTSTLHAVAEGLRSGLIT